MQIEIFKNSNEEDLQEDVNSFMSNNDFYIRDIQYRMCYRNKDVNSVIYSVMIVYQDGRYKNE